MAGKRNATSELTDRNWDQEDEPEEAGRFKVADVNVLATRKIKTARRRKLSGGDSGETKSPFTGFAGFTGLAKTTSSAAPSFSFGNSGSSSAPSFNFNSSNGNSSAESKTTTAAPTFNFGAQSSSNGNKEENKTEASKPTFSFGSSASSETISKKESDNKPADGGKPLFAFGQSSSAKTDSSTTDSPSKTNKAKYFSKLKALNESVAKWIKDNVDKNPLCVLTPIFKDYETHLAEIEKFNPESKKEGEPKESTTFKADVSVPSFPTFSFNKTSETSKKNGADSSATKIDDNTTTPLSDSKPLSSSVTTLTSVTPASTDAPKPFASGFSFGSSKNTTAAFGTGSTTTGFSFKPLAAQATESKPAEGREDEEYVPPKAEVRTINEEGAVYTKRCKLFYKLDNEWKDKGVGNLHIKPGDNNKTQLIVRADTNLGTILLNILLAEGLPTSRQGKNNVMMVCVPNPPIKGIEGAAPMLIRVKTGDDADELLSKLEENKS